MSIFLNGYMVRAAIASVLASIVASTVGFPITTWQWWCTAFPFGLACGVMAGHYMALQRLHAQQEEDEDDE